MIDFAFDSILHDPDISFFEEDWVFVYNSKKKQNWPELNSFKEYHLQDQTFKETCTSQKLDPDSHATRVGFRVIPYPNCTRHNGFLGDDSWGEFSTTYPNTDYFRFIDYLHAENVSFNIWETESAPNQSFYPIGINTYQLDFDYFSEISDTALCRLKNNNIKILFFYHEADNPFNIQKHLLNLCSKHKIDPNQIFFISGNTAADDINNFFYFFDDEILYQNSINVDDQVKFHTNTRDNKFTALVRIHKLWRAIFMSELWKAGVNTQGYFSYNQIVQSKESNEVTCQPFDREFIESKYRSIQNFLAAGPFKADNLGDTNHNSFMSVHKAHFENSYCNFVIETHFSLESRKGTSLTEKIIKPICHSQFFILIGPPHTLKALRKFGYKTFGRVIDESYDKIQDDQKRMEAVTDLCIKIASMPLHELHKLYLELKPEIMHNSNLFAGSKKERLTDLINKLQQ